jgi:hypothetical protein
MTELNQAVDNQQPVAPPLNGESNTASEKLVPQQKVNDLIGVGYQKGYSKALEDFQKQHAANSQPMPANNLAQNPNDIQKVVSDAVQQKLEEHKQSVIKEQQNQHATQIMNDIVSRTNEAKSRYKDFDNVVGQVDWNAFPEVLLAAHGVANTGDVMYELAKNQMKLGGISKLAEKSPQMAMAQMRELSNSIQNNQQATAQKGDIPPEPLSQVNPSNVGMDSGAKSVRDLKKIYRT